jgi:(2Fe-2S) ferredoxin
VDVLRAPYKKLLLVCTHERDDERPSCGARDSGAIHQQLKRRIADLELPYIVRASRTGCLDLCPMGPVVVVYPEGRVFAGVRISDVERILQELFGSDATAQDPLT